MTAPPILTIAIPTFNRVFYVTTAIESLRSQTNSSGRWRVVVVDNNSTDETLSALQKISIDWPRLSVVKEPKQGLSHARNRALEMCGDGWLLFADDESKFPMDYVERALGIVDTRQPVMFGGPIYPWYTQVPPKWWSDDYGSFSLPWQAGPDGRIYLSGGNMGFDVEALRSVGGFDPELGMRGKAIGFGEETLVELAIVSRFGGERVWFDPEFINFHAVRPDKFRVSHMLREHFQRGIARAKLPGFSSIIDRAAPTPESLRARPAPVRVVQRGRRLQQRALHYGLAAVRRFGAYSWEARRLVRLMTSRYL